MGADAHEKARKPAKFQMQGPRIWLPLDVLQGAAYASLSTTAKALLLDLSAQLRAKYGEITNNGDLTTAMSVLSEYGWKNDKTVLTASRQLEKYILIVKTRQGCLPNRPNLFALTWLPLNECDKLNISAKGFPFKGYKKFDKQPQLKNVNA